ncbi:hypothetical protein [Streptomyces sp. NPDC000658]
MVLAIVAIALLAAVKAGALWFTIVPSCILFMGASAARSLGWFDERAGD